MNVNEEGGQFERLRVLVLERNAAESGAKTEKRISSLTKKGSIAEHVNIVDGEAYQSQVRTIDVEHKSLLPDRIKSVVLCIC